MDKYYDQKMKHLIALRSNIIAILIVLVGGLFGLHLLQLPALIYWGSLLLGLYYLCVFIYNLIITNKDILELLEEMKND